MNKTEISTHQQRSPGISLLFLAILCIAGLFFGNFIGALIVVLLNGFSQETLDILQNPTGHPEAQSIILILQATGAIFSLLIAPVIHIVLVDKKPVSDLFNTKNLYNVPLIVVFFLTLALIVANSVVIEWNLEVDYSWISPAFEQWARGMEQQLEDLTRLLTNFDTFGGFLVGFIVIAIIPGIGEELVFRGLVQPKLQIITKNPHVAIWLTAFLFSAIHFQFYGFFPRVLLGALFGYIYYWSGNLIYPMVAHFINNGFTLLMLYMYQQRVTDFDIESVESVPLPTVMLALAIGTGLLFYFRNFFRRKMYAE
jgi:uncharacterized protein